MSAPIIDVFMFEDVLEVAVSSHLLANGVNEPKKQRDDNALPPSRVEVKAICNGWGPNSQAPHQWIHSIHGKLPDTQTGRLFCKIVTSRGDPDQNHARLRGTIRALMQSCSALTAKMALHKMEKIEETGTTPDFGKDRNEDSSMLSFDFVMRILFDTKTTQIFPT